MASTVTVRWRKPGEREHFLLLRRSQGGDADNSVDVSLSALSAAERPRWPDPAVGSPCPVFGTPTHTGVQFTVPDGTASVRLTFSVRLRVRGEEDETLTVLQHLSVTSQNQVVPDAYQLPAYAVSLIDRGGGDTVRQRVPRWEATTRTRPFLGHHPLLQVTAGNIAEIDTEFLDVTNLWWALHFKLCPNNIERDFNPWYLEPTCNDQPDRLRVLLSTRVTPMLWFATVPRTASTGDAPPISPDLPDGTTVGGYLFFRPIGSAYSYPSTGPEVLTHPQHATRGMRNMCRYLLRGHTRSGTTAITGLPDWYQLLDHSTNVTQPLLSYDALPCGMEYALDRTLPKLLSETKSLRVLFLPVPDKGSPSFSYGGNAGPHNADRLSAALRLLWSRGAFGGSAQQLLRTGELQPPVPPQPGLTSPASGTLRLADEAWVGAYSSGGHALWQMLSDPGNRASTSRVLVFDTVRFRDTGIPRILATAKDRKGKLEVRITWSPYAMGSPPPEFLSALRALGAPTQVWPTAGQKYFAPPPNPDNHWAEYVFADARPWTPSKFPEPQMSQWWHQFAVFAGEELHDDPRNTLSVSFMETMMRP